MRRGLLRGIAACAAALLAPSCADEFAVDPPDGFTAILEQDWADELIVGDTVVLVAEVRDEASGARVDPAAIEWTAAPAGILQLLSADGDSARFRVVGIGDVQITASLDDPAFDTASVRATVPAVLAGIAIQAPAPDTLHAFGQPAALRVVALDAQGAALPVGGFAWEVHGAAVVPLGAQTADSLRVAAAANGAAWVVVSHPQCSSAGTCRDSALVAVQQVAAAVLLPADLTLRALGAAATISAEARDSGGSVIAGAPVLLSQLGGAGVASLSGATITALGTGQARVVASLGALADTMTVTVTQVPYTLDLSPDSVEFNAIGAHLDLTLAVKDSLGSSIPVVAGIVWETSAAAVVSVDPDSNPTRARIEAEGNGSAFVRARLGALVAETRVVVTQVATSLIVAGGAGQSGPVGTLLPDSLRVEARDAAGSPVSGAQVTWTVLSGGGTLAGSAMTGSNGRAAVAWTLGPLVGTQQVRASIAGADPVVFSALGLAGVPASVTVEPASATLTFVTDTAHLTATVRDAGGNVLPVPVTWSSTNEGVATVGPTGIVTAVTGGIASIIATAGALADTVPVTVSQQVSTITLSHAADTLSVGDSIQLTATARDAGGAVIPGAPITWTTTNEQVGTVQAGRVRAVGRGVADIVASSNGALATFDLTVAAFAMAFDGGDLLEIASAPALELDTAFTIELWVRPRSTTGGALIARWDGQNQGSSYALYLRGLVPRMLIRQPSGPGVDSVSATIALVPDAWHHVAFVFDNGVGTFYVNGVLAGAAVGLAAPRDVSAPLRVGADALVTPTYLTGDVDEIRIWRVARAPAEILADRAARLGVQAGLAVYYPLYLGAGDPVDLVGGLVAVRGDGLGPDAFPAWILDGSPAP